MGASDSRPVASKFTVGEENARIKYGASSMQGYRREMEDAHAAILDLDGSKSTPFFGVYDGHGGAEVALYCEKRFHIELVNDPDYDNNLAIAMEHVFFRIDEKLQQSDEWRELANPGGNGKWIKSLKTGVCAANVWPMKAPYIGPQQEGSTACVALIRGNQIIVGNVGDSRCVLSRNSQAINLSTDHIPNHRNGRERIQRAGGQVLRDGFAKVLPGRVAGMPLAVYRVDGKLALSRAIGDFQFNQNKNLPPAEQMVTCNPGIRTVDITDDTEFLLIASDSIWDVMTSQQAVDLFICQYLQFGEKDLCAICERLLDLCIRSHDNSTVILVQFKADTPPHAEPEVDPTAIASTSAEAKADTGTSKANQAAPLRSTRRNPAPTTTFENASWRCSWGNLSSTEFRILIKKRKLLSWEGYTTVLFFLFVEDEVDVMPLCRMI